MAYKVVGYFENWAQYRQGGGKFFPDQIDPSLFTHINFAFGLFGFVTWSIDPTETRTGHQRLTGNYSIQPVEWNDQTVLYPAIQKLKEKNPTLKTLLSIGGWSINSCDDQPNPGNPHPYGPYTCHLFSQMAADPQGRQQFIQSAISYAQRYGFDGIDIDWEYPGYIGRGGTDADFENFLLLIQEFRAQAGPNFLLTWAAPAVMSTGVSASGPIKDATSYFQWVAQCAQSFDWLNVMSYDYHGAFDDPIKVGTGVNVPLLQDSTPNGPFSIKNTVEAYLQAGIPQDKIVLGMPTYGRSFTVSSPLTATDNGYGKPFSGAGPAGPATQVPGDLAYYEILAQLASGDLTEAWDEATLTPYAYNSTTGVWVSYDNAKSLAYKVSYLSEQELGGAMVWAIDDDAFSDGFPLLRTINETLADPSLRPPLPVLTSVQSADIWWSGDQKLSPEVGLSGAPGLAVYQDKLYCLHQGKDGFLWLTVFDGSNWSADKPVATSGGSGKVGISGAPGLAVYQDKLYCLHQGYKNDGWLWLTVFDGSNWSADTKVMWSTSGRSGQVGISSSPAVAVYQDKLYCLHQGRGDDGWLWLTVFDGSSWSADTKVQTSGTSPNVGITDAPGLAVYQDKLYCLHQGYRNDGWLWLTVFDGSSWSADTRVQTSGTSPNVGITGAPGLAVYQDQLYCLHQGQKQDGWLWLTVFDGLNWSQDIKVQTLGASPNVGITGAPGLAAYQDKLYCLHQGLGDDAGTLWFTIGTRPTRWSGQQQQSLAGGIVGSPAVAVYQDKLYCLHQGKDNFLWQTVFDGSNWSADTRVQTSGGSPNVGLSGAPGLAVYQDKLYCLHQGYKNDGWLWLTVFDGSSWSADTKVMTSGRSGQVGISSSPAVAVYQDKLYCLHQGYKNDDWLWLTVFDGSSWSADTKVMWSTSGRSGQVGISSSPAVAVYQDKLYCLHQGRGDDGWLWQTVFDGSSWSADTRVQTVGTSSNVGISGGPAAAVFRDHLYALHQGQKRDNRLWLTFFDGSSWAPDETLTTEGGAGRDVAPSAPPAAVVFQDKFYAVYNQDGMLAYTIGDVGTGAVPWVDAHGLNSYVYGELDSGITQHQQISTIHTIAVPAGAPYLSAVLTRSEGSVDFPTGAQLTIQGPDGTNYDHDIQAENQLLIMSGSSVRCLLVKDPKPGNWTMRVTAPADVDFHCECNTAPSQDVYNTITHALSADLQARDLSQLQQGGNEIWGWLGAAAVALITGAGLLAVGAVTPIVAGFMGVVTGGAELIAYQWSVIKEEPPNALARYLTFLTQNEPPLKRLVDDLKTKKFSEVVAFYMDLIGRNFSFEEFTVVMQNRPQDLYGVMVVYARVFLYVEHMTDPEEQNAVRHVLWQCLLKKRFGEDFARKIGDAHEHARPGSDADNKADEINNRIGLQLADQVASEDLCFESAQNLWKAGKLQTRPDLESDPT